MHISEEIYNLENKNLDETNEWLINQIKNIDEDNKELKERISKLKKSNKGVYDYEIDTNTKLYEFNNQTLEKYKEVQDRPYFARIDFKENRREEETFYIGKIGLGDLRNSDEKVIDWRAPIADLYYSGVCGEASYDSPIGVVNGQLNLKRKFIIRDKKLIDAFDEGGNSIILKGNDNEEKSLMDEFLKINLESNVQNKLKDVVATIQKEQNDVIRFDKNKALVVQGSAGSGKTTVALHRLAYLLYKYNKEIKGEDVLVIAPNKIFLDYISEVLPDLGVNMVVQETFEHLAVKLLKLKGKIYSKDKKLAHIIENQYKEDIKYMVNSSKIKGSLIFKTILDRYIKLMEVMGIDYEDLKVEGYVLFDKKEIKKLFLKDLSHMPLNKRKKEMYRYFSSKINSRISKLFEQIDLDYSEKINKAKELENEVSRKEIIRLYDERDEKKANLKKQARKDLKEYFKNFGFENIKEFYIEFFNNDILFEMATDGKIPKPLAEYMIKEINSNVEKKITDSDDLAAMMYLKLKLEGIDDSFKFKHIVVDEAQDYSMLEALVIQLMSVNDSLTMVGDLGQSIYYYKSINSWDKLIDKIYNNLGKYIPLTQSYRSTVEIVEFANKVLEKQNLNMKSCQPVLRHGMEPKLIKCNDKEFCLKLDNIIKDVHNAGKQNVAVICKTVDECKKVKKLLDKNSEYEWSLVKDTDENIDLKNIIITSYMTKGLEFDCSVIYNCNKENYKNVELDKKLLYVMLTRALHMEYIFFKDEVSELLT